MSRRVAWSIVGGAAVVALIAVEVVRTGPQRGAARTYSALIGAGNRRDLDAARRLCTDRYLKTHRLALAEEGGLVGLPRNIHKNFQVWRDGGEVRLCPTNRVGPVYRFVREGDAWKFDGPIGLLMPGGRVAPMDETLNPEAPTPAASR